MQKRYPELSENLPTNPLPASYEITPRKAEEIKELSAAIRAQKFAGRRAGQGRPADLEADPPGGARDRARVPRRGRSCCSLASTLLIANTIRLSIFSRRREIEVMKLVGATNWFVRGPFMLEGLLCGLRRRLRRGRSCSLLGKEIALPSILGAHRLRRRRARARLRAHRADPPRRRPPRRGARLGLDAPPLPPGLIVSGRRGELDGPAATACAMPRSRRSRPPERRRPARPATPAPRVPTAAPP